MARRCWASEALHRGGLWFVSLLPSSRTISRASLPKNIAGFSFPKCVFTLAFLWLKKRGWRWSMLLFLQSFKSQCEAHHVLCPWMLLWTSRSLVEGSLGRPGSLVHYNKRPLLPHVGKEAWVKRESCLWNPGGHILVLCNGAWLHRHGPSSDAQPQPAGSYWRAGSTKKREPTKNNRDMWPKKQKI